MSAPAKKKNRAALVLLVLGGLSGVCLLGTLGAVAVPNMLEYRTRSKQSEAQYMLKVLLTKEQEFRAARGYWATTPRELQEIVASAPRSSTCFLGPGAGWGGRGGVSFEQLPLPVRERLTANLASVAAQQDRSDPEGDLVLACAVNLDQDPALEVWTISARNPVPSLASPDLGP